MPLPAQIQKQSEAVNKLYEELNSDDVADNDAAAKDVDLSQADSSDEGGAVPEAEEQADGDRDDKSLEQKYKTLQGMYNAEVPRLHAEKRELANRVQQLEQLFATMSTQPAQEQAPSQKLVTDQDIADYGDSIDVMRRVFREEMQSKDAEISELKALVRQMQGTVVPQVHQLAHKHAVSSEQRFWADLQSVVPDWQDINTNKDFQSWLLEVDPLTGVTRQTYLDDAQRNLDVRRVATFFDIWKDVNGSGAHKHREAQISSELERQVSPGKARTVAQTPQGSDKTYTPEDIRVFFSDVQKGKYRGRESERDRIERDIFAAQREGRIVTQ